MPPRSVLFVNRVFPPDTGATGRLLAEVAGHMAGQGWQVTVVADGQGDTDIQPGLAVRRTGARVSAAGARDYLGSLGRLAWLALRQPRHDVVVTMADPPLLHLAGPALKSRHGGALVNWCQDLYPELFPLVGLNLPRAAGRGLERLSTAALSRCDALVPIGDCMADRLGVRGLDRRRIHPLSNWPQAELLAGRPDRAALEAMVPATRGRLVLLYAGTLGLAHPMAPLVEAARRLHAAGAAVQVVVMGAGRRREALAQAAAGLPNLSLLPYLGEAEAALVSATADLHLALMAPDAEGLLVPCKVPAALGAGRPILFCGPAGGAAGLEVARAGAGRVLPPDGRAIADAVLGCLDDPSVLTGWTAAAARARDGLRASPGEPAFAALVAKALDARVGRPAAAQLSHLPVPVPPAPGKAA